MFFIVKREFDAGADHTDEIGTMIQLGREIKVESTDEINYAEYVPLPSLPPTPPLVALPQILSSPPITSSPSIMRSPLMNSIPSMARKRSREMSSHEISYPKCNLNSHNNCNNDNAEIKRQLISLNQKMDAFFEIALRNENKIDRLTRHLLNPNM